MRFLMMMLCAVGLVLPLRAGEVSEDVLPNTMLDRAAWEARHRVLPFWEISPNAFSADNPQPLLLSDLPAGFPPFWYWSFRFRVETNLDKLRQFLKQDVLPNVREENRTYYEGQLERLDATLADPLRLDLAMTLHLDTGDLISDTSNVFVRDLIRRRTGRHYLTVAEINALDLEPGQEIEGVALFPRLPSHASRIRIRVVGLGRRFTPHYQPGELLYLQNAYDASIRRALDFSYQRFSNTEDPALDRFAFQDRNALWVWIWPTQTYVGRPRTLKMSRPSGRALEFRYVPYWIWNNTYTPQTLDVLEAGIEVRIQWHGFPLSLRFVDHRSDRNLWITQALRRIEANIKEGREEAFVRQYETHSLAGASDENEASDPLIGGSLEGSETPADRQKADIEAKTLILPEGERHIAGEILPGQRARGLMVIRWDLRNLEAVLDDLISRFRSFAFTTTPKEAPPLYNVVYFPLRASSKEGQSVWRLPPEPTRQQVLDRLVEIAERELIEKSVTITEEDKRYYGPLAPLGTLLTHLAAEALEKQVSTGVVQGYFVINHDGMLETCAFPSSFRRNLPKPRHPFVPPTPDDLAVDTENQPTSQPTWSQPADTSDVAEPTTTEGGTETSEEDTGDAFTEDFPW